MNHSAALSTLVRALTILGIDFERVDIHDLTDSPDKLGIEVVIGFPNDNLIRILVSDFWRYPTMSCYFVNFQHTCGDFQCNVGTPHIECALRDIGQCMASFVLPKV